MQLISTYTELQRVLDGKAKRALDKTMADMLDKLKDFVNDEVYSYPQTWYERTNEVKDNWRIEEAKSDIHGVEGNIYFDNDISHSGYPLYQHGIDQIDGDTLLKILIGEYPTGDAFGVYPNPRDFWQPFLDWAEKNFDRLFEENMKSLM